MEGIRLATADEVAQIQAEADISTATSVLRWPIEKPMTAVMRNCIELDPVYYGENPVSRKAMFIWAIENMMRSMGVKEYYFNVPADDEDYQKVLSTWGAEKISKNPEFRYKKVL